MRTQTLKQEMNNISDTSVFLSSIRQVRDTKQPLIFTQDGKNEAILLNIENYEAILEELDLLKDIKIAEEQIRTGKVFSDEEAKKRLLEMF